ncbi:MAG TPA: hypothetical protein VFP55_05350, partial [Solirubrobacteraceae bacterium]|nr:hypothetical protein [Solirubrobacteraceae bacterium]
MTDAPSPTARQSGEPGPERGERAAPRGGQEELGVQGRKEQPSTPGQQRGPGVPRPRNNAATAAAGTVQSGPAPHTTRPIAEDAKPMV